MKPDKFPLKGKTTLSVIPVMAFEVIIAGVITGYTTRQVVCKEITNTTLPGYRSPVLNTLTGMMNTCAVFIRVTEGRRWMRRT